MMVKMETEDRNLRFGSMKKLNADGNMTKRIAPLESKTATDMVHLCRRRLSFVFEVEAKTAPIRIMPKTTNIKERLVWETIKIKLGKSVKNN